MKRDEVWYCVNSKGHKIPPYGTRYTVPKSKKWTFNKILNLIGIIIGITIITSIIFNVSF